nr:hydrolase [Gemmatimonadaceae bacterium]
NFGVAGADTTHYTFAHLDQSTLSLTSRINYTASPTLSLQFYAQPFITKGRYSDWRELANPRAERYDDRYRPYSGDPGGFDIKELRSNTVVRWEYRPGSTLFLVWSQGREFSDGRPADFAFSRDLGDLFRLHPNNTFLLKASYWFNP